MSAVEQLLKAVDEAARQGDDAVLATVVKVEGSAYRRPGARMLINALGQTEGTVSGGCLETEVARTARWLTERGPALRSYSTAEEDEDGDAAVRFGLGCNGTVHLLFERVDSVACQLLLDGCRALTDGTVGLSVATVVSASQPDLLGQRLLLTADDQLQGSLPDAWSAPLLPLLRQARSARRAALHCFRQPGGAVEVLIEHLRPARRLVIFGGGHDAQPLVRMAKLQGLHVTVIDSRAHFARRSRFPEADAVLLGQLDNSFALKDLLADAAVVVMTHSLQQDAWWLAQALASSACYIGQLGPRERTERLLAGMAQASLPGVERLHYPVGLDLGGDTPESVALAILGEMTAVLNGRVGGMLQQRQSAIHEPSAIHIHDGGEQDLPAPSSIESN
ncbi:hypothetical protein GCM10007421_20650 [Halopseudomonas oceani]|uniref:Xanthine dehydrogenase n=1 Tax=Halopseudomonas oceani TaxID=1708783 RepID=A0A2P4EW20_9GAMM|nr:XdhC/CoxI family protein [Halopseudomonas oceani]POB03824.1 xanthine dehydrogenase [Halopseudomonas oceani]GGE46325.1 hypothetical protein GCM10007421_20650 [Halopseudomonas oceani]